jgi:hypothetical protein
VEMSAASESKALLPLDGHRVLERHPLSSEVRHHLWHHLAQRLLQVVVVPARGQRRGVAHEAAEQPQPARRLPPLSHQLRPRRPHRRLTQRPPHRRLRPPRAVGVPVLLAELAIEVSTLRVVHRQGGERAIQASIGGQEQAASVVWDYQDEIVPGLLQTPDYTRAVVPQIDPTLPDIDDLVAGRSERQRVLYDRTKSFRFLLQEAALRGRVAPTDVLRGQLDRLQALTAALPHVELRVLPFTARLTARALTSYRVIDDTVEVELQRDTVTIRDPRDVAMYRNIFDTLWRLALDGEEFMAFIRSVDLWLAGLGE